MCNKWLPQTEGSTKWTWDSKQALVRMERPTVCKWPDEEAVSVLLSPPHYSQTRNSNRSEPSSVVGEWIGDEANSHFKVSTLHIHKHKYIHVRGSGSQSYRLATHASSSFGFTGAIRAVVSRLGNVGRLRWKMPSLSNNGSFI